MAQIVNILSENALQLKQEEFVRGLSFGNNWNKIRIGMLARVNGNVTIATPRLHIGLSNGTTNTLASSTCSGYLAVKPYAASGGFVYDGVNNRFNMSNGNYFYNWYYKVGASATESLSALFTGNSYISASTSPSLSLIGAQFQRTATNAIQVVLLFPSLAQYTFGSPTTSDLYNIMENEGADSWFGNWLTFTTMTNLTSLPAGVTQLDSVSIYWNQTAAPLEIGTLLVSRFY